MKSSHSLFFAPMDKILRHPVLKEPAKWIPRLRQQHALELEAIGFYDVSALKHNPLVKGLEATQSSVKASKESTAAQMGTPNVSMAIARQAAAMKYSRGAVVRLVVSKDPCDGELGLEPIIGESSEERPLFTAIYVYNNKNYLRHILFGDLLWRKYAIPFKFKFNNRLNRGIVSSLVERDIPQLMERTYQLKILDLLPEKSDESPINVNGNGLILSSKGDACIMFRGSVPVINLTKIWPAFQIPEGATEFAIPYKGNEQLCHCIFSFVDFMPEVSGVTSINNT